MTLSLASLYYGLGDFWIEPIDEEGFDLDWWRCQEKHSRERTEKLIEEWPHMHFLIQKSLGCWWRWCGRILLEQVEWWNPRNGGVEDV